MREHVASGRYRPTAEDVADRLVSLTSADPIPGAVTVEP